MPENAEIQGNIQKLDGFSNRHSKLSSKRLSALHKLMHSSTGVPQTAVGKVDRKVNDMQLKHYKTIFCTHKELDRVTKQCT